MESQSTKKKTSAKLINLENNKIFLIEKSIKVGRGEDAEVKVEDQLMSRIHFSIMIEGDKDIWIHDLSKNGTFVNGSRVDQKKKLVGITQIKAGNTTFEYEPNQNDITNKDHHAPLSSHNSLSNSNSKIYHAWKNKDNKLNIESYSPASLMKRILAFIIDSSVTTLGFSLLLNVYYKYISYVNFDNGYLIIFIHIVVSVFVVIGITWSYYYFQYIPFGQSLGKWLLGIKVISTRKSGKISAIDVVIRELVIKPFGILVSLMLCFSSIEKRAFHDIFSDTLVIESKKGSSTLINLNQLKNISKMKYFSIFMVLIVAQILIADRLFMLEQNSFSNPKNKDTSMTKTGEEWAKQYKSVCINAAEAAAKKISFEIDNQKTSDFCSMKNNTTQIQGNKKSTETSFCISGILFIFEQAHGSNRSADSKKESADLMRKICW